MIDVDTTDPAEEAHALVQRVVEQQMVSGSSLGPSEAIALAQTLAMLGLVGEMKLLRESLQKSSNRVERVLEQVVGKLNFIR